MDHTVYLKKIGQTGGLKNTEKQRLARAESVKKMNAVKAERAVKASRSLNAEG